MCGSMPTDKEAELHTNGMYNEAIRLADEAKDAATRELLESIVKEEDAHVDWLEAQLDQIAQLGVPLYLSTQTRA
jgi:bacterioferritin